MKIEISEKDYGFSSEIPISDLALNYMRFLLSGDRESAYQVIYDAIEQGHDIKEINLDVFQRTQEAIGYLWETEQISVAKEHYCTAATQMLMAKLFSRMFVKRKKKKTAVIACVGGELHELGSRMVADFFEMDGWETYYVGANTPTESLIQTLKEQQAELIGISVTMSYNLSKLYELIQRIRPEIEQHDVKIIIGGRPFTLSTDLWKKFDVDGFGENAKDAVKVANQLVKEPGNDNV